MIAVNSLCALCSAVREIRDSSRGYPITARWYDIQFHQMSLKTPITGAYGDGFGREIMEASLDIIQRPGAALELEAIESGENVYLRGNTAGIDPCSPTTTPQSGGFKSLNVTAIHDELGAEYPDIEKEPWIVNIGAANFGGTPTWPDGMAETFVTDSYRCCFQHTATAPSHAVTRAAGYDIVKTETLHTFDGQQGFTLAQGQ
jgi:Bacterial isocitrate dehydrogenase, C-terminal domain